MEWNKKAGMRLRVHHLLCIPLYNGYGYGDAFCRNMEQVIERLETYADEPMAVVCSSDMICGNCPNLTAWNTCRTSGNHVDEKDKRLAKEFGIVPGTYYTYRQLKELVRRELTEQVFENSCRNCEWFAKGLCTYEKWRQSI